MDFDPDPNCDTCGGDLGWPGSYSESMGVDYNCTMCGMMEATTYIEVSEMPTDYLIRLFTYASRIDASIERDGNDPRYDDLRAAVAEELDERGEPADDIELTHVVYTNKARANEIEEQFPGVSTIGSTPDDAEYEFGTPHEEMDWEALVAEDEAKRLSQWDEVTVEAL